MFMLLLGHILIAISSMVYTSYLFFRPSNKGIKIASSLVVLTLVSGTYLVVSLKSQILSACITGLVYLAAVAAGLVAARYRLSVQNTEE
jgi:hypothetical protein